MFIRVESLISCIYLYQHVSWYKIVRILQTETFSVGAANVPRYVWNVHDNVPERSFLYWLLTISLRLVLREERTNRSADDTRRHPAIQLQTWGGSTLHPYRQFCRLVPFLLLDLHTQYELVALEIRNAKSRNP